ncbi:MAG: glycosyltransferase [Patescibacteria group bacterium]
MKKQFVRLISGGAFLTGALMGANFLNFVFNAYLGRRLAPEEFGVLTLFGTLLLLIGIAAGALGATVNYVTSYEVGEGHASASVVFFRRIQRRAFFVSLGVALVWFAVVPALGAFFHIEHTWVLGLFALVLPVIIITSASKGFLQGQFFFAAVGFAIFVEAIVKLGVVYILVERGLREWVVLSFPTSLIAGLFVAQWFASRAARRLEDEDIEKPLVFPKTFYIASFISGFSGIAYLTFDLVLAKHYLNPELAGQYALLSLVGKMIYFFGSLLNGFMITFIANAEGAHKNPNKIFYRIFAGACVLTFGAYSALGIFGSKIVPILLGERALGILPYLPTYALAITCLTLASAFNAYHLARKHYLFPFTMLVMACVMALGIMRSHSSIVAISNVMLFSSVLTLGVMTVLHILLRNGKFILRALIDLVDIARPFRSERPALESGKRILIFNWRDTKHAFAGGAEIHIHEFAKRWVATGNSVTIFCGNDGKSKREEEIDGVRIIRRGGFYFVYVWAFFYYLLRFRGQFDIIVDCQNGVPFFAPLYAKEKVYSLLFHVHQDVFYHSLPRVLALFAAFLENTVMPWAYRGVEFITISESTKKGMERFLGIRGARISVVHPGVDLARLRPGEKSDHPLVVYVGRLKKYKSVDVLLRAFKYVVHKFPEAELVIAGRGEEEMVLKDLTRTLGISQSVRFAGGISDSEKTRLLQRAWVFVNPSFMEGWGITTIEANACGVAVVAADVPGLRDSVRNPHTGYLVPHGDAKAFAEKISELIHGREVRTGMEREAVLWASHFGWDEKSAECLEILYGK